MSWIHIADFLAVVLRLLDDEMFVGVAHVTSPAPVQNAELMAVLRGVVHRPPAPPTPAPLVRLGAALLRSDPALALRPSLRTSATTSRRLRVRVPELRPALDC